MDKPESIDLAVLVAATLTEYPDWRPALERMVAWEDAHTWSDEWDGWQWHGVHVEPRILNRMVAESLINLVSESQKYRHYRLADLGATRRGLAMGETEKAQPYLEKAGPAADEVKAAFR